MQCDMSTFGTKFHTEKIMNVAFVLYFPPRNKLLGEMFVQRVFAVMGVEDTKVVDIYAEMKTLDSSGCEEWRGTPTSDSRTCRPVPAKEMGQK